MGLVDRAAIDGLQGAEFMVIIDLLRKIWRQENSEIIDIKMRVNKTMVKSMRPDTLTGKLLGIRLHEREGVAVQNVHPNVVIDEECGTPASGFQGQYVTRSTGIHLIARSDATGRH